MPSDNCVIIMVQYRNKLCTEKTMCGNRVDEGWALARPVAGKVQELKLRVSDSIFKVEW